jgi:hypothetical protein
VTTKAKFDIWNMNETRFSGTERCLTCWDQTLISSYTRLANHFLLENLQTNKGKARIDGVASAMCDEHPDCPIFGAAVPLGFTDSEQLVVDRICPPEGCSQHAALLGVAAKLLVFSTAEIRGVAQSGMNLMGMGMEAATILYDAVGPPQPLRVPTSPEIGADGLNAASPTDALQATRKSVRGQGQRSE